jgi:hypothetical protein
VKFPIFSLMIREFYVGRLSENRRRASSEGIGAFALHVRMCFINSRQLSARSEYTVPTAASEGLCAVSVIADCLPLAVLILLPIFSPS